ncbi:hypothetical protein Mycsm_06574 (plasmid) [Mycobacterium sp. JS623]|uniref:DUF6185 family protein n=1 Tax=Mycobacterium sp. JS623 TaxID=212767 RepID=UPI0002A5A027|nr:DUF6185 family protein [Mycobacterium sp. JS623]AGB26711.1 hypothetical protein Mycsm_06574 [Mycobacterium sp. JS623]
MATVEKPPRTSRQTPHSRLAFLKSWPFWIALVSFPIAIWAGWVHQPPHGEVLLEPKGDNCPDYSTLTSTSTTTVGAPSTTLEISTELHLTLTGVTPASPPVDENLGELDSPNNFTGCFLATDARIKSIVWADGRVDAVFELADSDPTVSRKLGRDHSSLTVDPCNPTLFETDWIPAVCEAKADNTVLVRTTRPIGTVLTAPFPTQTKTDGDTVETTWHFMGSTPPLTIDIDVPFTVMATSWLYGSEGSYYTLQSAHSKLGIDLQYLTDVSAFWMAVLATTWILRRRNPELRWWQRFNYRILLVFVAGALLAVWVPKVGHLGSDMTAGFVTVAVWGVLSAALAPRKWLSAIGTLVAALVAILGILAVTLPPHPVQDVLLNLYLALLLILVGTGAWTLWQQMTTIFTLTQVDERPTQWQVLYGKVLSCVVIGAFVIAVGFPIGTVLNRGGYTYDQSEYLAANLTMSTGILFREALAWMSILLLVSFLTAYCVGNGTAAAIPIAAVLALMLSLSAPWTDRMSIVVVTAIPVWLLQFGVLWVAFRRLTMRGDDRYLAHAAEDVEDTELLRVAIGKALIPAGASGTDDQGQASADDALTKRTRAARQRLLALGPRKNRLDNAKVSAQISGVVAIVPVAYMIWTTLSSLGDRFSTNTGLLIVVVFALLELVRWVVSGFVFGYLYADLPGRIGPVKALSFSAIYIISCAAPLMVAQGFGRDLLHEAIYRSSQFALFTIVLAVLYDLWTVRSRDGDWQELQAIYDLQEDYGRIAATVAPAAILLLTVGHQIVAGSGFDVANSLLSGITSVLK